MSILLTYQGQSCQAVDHLPMAQQNVKLSGGQTMPNFTKKISKKHSCQAVDHLPMAQQSMN